MKYKTIIFDFDGTILDTAPGIVAAMKEIFLKKNLPVPEEEVLKSKIGLTSRNAYAALGFCEQELDSTVDTYREIYRKYIFTKSKPFDGMVDVLHGLAEQGVSLAVASNRSQPGLDKLVENFNLTGLFQYVVSTDDVERPKPEPEMLNVIFDKYGVAPEEVLMVGDTVNDILSGVNAGCDTCWVTFGYGEAEKVKALNPTYTVNNSKELLSIL